MNPRPPLRIFHSKHVSPRRQLIRNLLGHRGPEERELVDQPFQLRNLQAHLADLLLARDELQQNFRAVA